MATAFTRLLERLHASTNLAVAASFRTASGTEWTALRVILTHGSDLPGAGARANSIAVDINGADLSAPPQRGDFIAIDGIQRRIESVTPDELMLSYACALSSIASPAAFTIGGSAVANTDTIA